MLWCVYLARAMVCSQRTASLSQSPRVGFLSSLLPQSKKSPSRLSPAQGPPQTQSSAKKDSLSSQVSVGPAFVCLSKYFHRLTQDSLSHMNSWVLFSGPRFWMCSEIPNTFLLFFLLPSSLPPNLVDPGILCRRRTEIRL